LKNIINNTDRKLEETINNIYKSKLFIGVSSGLAWIAWAIGKPVVMISGCTQDWNEPSDIYRVINKNVCYREFPRKPRPLAARMNWKNKFKIT